jgi:uncharacterized protein YjcR
MAENYVKAENDYVRGMKYKDIAEKSVKSWKKRYGWSRENGAHKNKRVHKKTRKGAHRRKIRMLLVSVPRRETKILSIFLRNHWTS